MKPFQVTILGNNSAIPAHGRYPTSQFIQINHQSILMDCGEGAQIWLREHPDVNLYHNTHIFLSHVHGDHCLGLMGIINSMALMNRKKDLHIHAHQAIIEFLRFQAEKMYFRSNFTIFYHIVPENGSGIICRNEYFEVHYFQLDHRVPCTGYKFIEKFGKKKIKIEQLKKHRIPKENWNDIQHGADFRRKDGTVIPHEELTIPHPVPRSYAFCSDTRYTEDFLENIAEVNLAYIESTYTNSEKNLAKDRYHCTAEDAATMAKKANVKRLLLGHFSSRYKQLSVFEQEARAVFTNTDLAVQGTTFFIEENL